MKYKAIIETDDYKDFEFYEDGIGKFLAVKDANATKYGGWIPLYFTEYQEPKMGHWIRKRDKFGRTFGVCSECNHLQYAGELNYCPYCGIKMIVINNW